MEQHKFNVYLNSQRQQGYLAYEYNPLHNYQVDEDIYLIDNKFLVPYSKAVNPKNGELLVKYGSKWKDKRGQIFSNEDVLTGDSEGAELFASRGSLIDLDTDKLNFDLEHPVEIEVQPSYDGSVNLILNDDKNIPRLINSRFSVREKDTYEIVDRIGENDTNIYNSKTFDKDTSLYFQYEYNPSITYLGFIKGVLPVGQYCFYFTYCDADDNESDIIAESGVIPVFIGSDRDPFSMDGGIKNQNSYKGINLKLTNIDKSYNYLKVYYVRYFADYQQNRVYECFKIINKYPITSNKFFLNFTGEENKEELDPNILNLTRFNPKSILTQAQCKNMLFFGNIVKNTDNYKELSDCALRIIPSLEIQSLPQVNNSYNSNNGNYGYYDSKNIYNKVGYFDQEYYRFGVVFIYQNGTLSNVYNTVGTVLKSNDSLEYNDGNLFTEVNNVLSRNYIEVDDRGWINSNSWIKTENGNFDNTFLNARGVCKIDANITNSNDIIGVKFTVPKEVMEFLKEYLNIRGLFFVRQKCVPNMLAQCYLLPMDEILEAPILKVKESDKYNYYSESFLTQGSDSRKILNDYDSRLRKYDENNISKVISNHAYAAICPDFLLNQPYYNQIFNGNSFKIQQITSSSSLTKKGRMYEESEGDYVQNKGQNKVIINTVTENVSTIAIKDKIYKLNIGQAEEAYRFGFAEQDVSSKSDDTESNYTACNFIRGIYSPYLAIYSDYQLETGVMYNIYQDNPININSEFQTRMDSAEPFYAISDRYNFDGLVNKENFLVCWRGDCFINTFTYRLNRNFNDPSLPNNDKIIDKNTWIEYYNSDSSNWSNISRSDVNAVQMGSWITFKVRSSFNYALRSEDHSYVSEEALMGNPRSFYPRSGLLHKGANKMPDSYLYNDAYRASLGFKCYFTLQDVNYIKNTFSNRIQYSAIAIQDSFKNNYRESFSTYFRDYSQEYGSIQKLIGFEGYLLVVFEHAIGIAVINERVLAGTGDGEPVFINTKNVLPEELTIISDTYGTQWGDSVIKTEVGYVYGVDTIAKKIWRVKGQQIEILSDFKVNKFLVENITLSEREINPIVGLKDVKTHYNNNKKDVIFTFYDDIYKDEENVWSLCYNELLDQFITFYSWVPSFSENIDTKFFTFNRETSKGLSLLNKCNYHILENSGILLDTSIINDISFNDYSIKLYYRDPRQNLHFVNYYNEIKFVKDQNQQLFIDKVQFRLEKDHWGNYNYFEIDGDQLKVKDIIKAKSEIFDKQKIVILYITPLINDYDDLYGISSYTNFKTESVALTLKSIVDNQVLTKEDKEFPNLTTDFYLHGKAGIFDVVEDLYPTYWYGEYHPFEFEFVVNDKIAQQKIFTDLVLIANKAEPESFHFEIEGDNYEFSSDKRNMYFRQEATKNLYQNLGSDILFDRKYTDIVADKLTQEQYYRGGDEYTNNYFKLDKVYPIQQKGLVKQVKSTIFPLYYEKIDTYNDIYYKYQQMLGQGYDFQNLSGSEVNWNRDLNQFDIVTHIKNTPIDLHGRLRGNSRYKEGKWNIQIPSITFMQKNENDWPKARIYDDLISDGPLSQAKDFNVPPIVINSQYIPKDLKTNQVNINTLPNIYKNSDPSEYIDTSNWTFRKETKIRDKWIKIRVRYSGKNLAIVHSIATLYNISYS